MCNKGKVAINDYFLHVKRIRFGFYGIQEGLTDEETKKNDPDDGERMQVLSFMTVKVYPVSWIWGSFIQFLGFEVENVFDHVMCWLWMQMTDVRCSRCSQIKVGLTGIFLAGHGDRYQVLLLFHTKSSFLGMILCIFIITIFCFMYLAGVQCLWKFMVRLKGWCINQSLWRLRRKQENIPWR